MSFGNSDGRGFGVNPPPNPLVLATNLIAAAIKRSTPNLTNFGNFPGSDRPDFRNQSAGTSFNRSRSSKGVKAPWAQDFNDYPQPAGSSASFHSGSRRPGSSQSSGALPRRRRGRRRRVSGSGCSSSSQKTEQKTKKPEEPTTSSSSTNRSSDPYEDVPKGLLKCTVCDVVASDGSSFERHLEGQPHKEMLDLLEEQHKRLANVLRQQSKIAEAQKGVDRNKPAQGRKSTETFCQMCDAEVSGSMVNHRKGKLHRNLKAHLHPQCRYCDVTFQSTREWDEHKLTRRHLLNISKAGVSNLEEGDCLAMFAHVKKQPKAEEATSTSDEKPEEGGENGVDDEEKKREIELLSEKNILNYELPEQEDNRAVGVSLVKPVKGFFCCICKKFFASNFSDHCKSQQHYQKFVDHVTTKQEKERKRVEHSGVLKRATSDVEDVVVEKRSKTEAEDVGASGENDDS